ncbi:hypothetical protein SHXM_02739 [Streptomyces hygroscopicus]|nr:hypothetical protein SHXM_02739 [Streptomyces hygroscopicus]
MGQGPRCGVRPRTRRHHQRVHRAERTAHHNKQAAINASTDLAHAFGRAIRQSGNTPFPSSAQVHFTLWQVSRTANLDFTSSYDDGNPIAGGRGQVTRRYSYAVTRMRALGASVTTRSLKARPRQGPDLRERELDTVYRKAFKAREQLASDAGGGELTSSEVAHAVGPHARPALCVSRSRRVLALARRARVSMIHWVTAVGSAPASRAARWVASSVSQSAITLRAAGGKAAARPVGAAGPSGTAQRPVSSSASCARMAACTRLAQPVRVRIRLMCALTVPALRYS